VRPHTMPTVRLKSSLPLHGDSAGSARTNEPTMLANGSEECQ
jgi:hypothetical protein